MRLVRVLLSCAFLVLLVLLILRILRSGEQEAKTSPPMAAGVAVSEPDHQAQGVPKASFPRTEHRREEPSLPPPPPPSPATPPVERIQASGTGFCTAQYPSTQRKALARRAAEVVARRSLAEAVAAHIRGETRVVQGSVVDDDILSTVDQVIKGARVISERELPEGGYEVTLEVSLRRRLSF